VRVISFVALICLVISVIRIVSGWEKRRSLQVLTNERNRGLCLHRVVPSVQPFVSGASRRPIRQETTKRWLRNRERIDRPRAQDVEATAKQVAEPGDFVKVNYAIVGSLRIDTIL
jgi:hypothetical protein